jgi:polysaccharide biosynthesis/export protein
MTGGLAFLVVGCGSLPAAAPTGWEIQHPGSESEQNLDYLLVDLDANVVQALAGFRPAGLAATFGVGGYSPSLQLRIGDSISVTIFEFGTTTLFGAVQPSLTPTPLPGPPSAATGTPSPPAQAAGHTTTLPTQIIDLNGKIEVPYAGAIPVAGLTPQQADAVITRALQDKAAEPQVIVTLVNTQQDVVSVGGDVRSPGRILLTLRGETVLDVIAAAGGPKFEAYETDVQLIRGGVNAIIPLQRILDEPGENITVQPNDQIYLAYHPRTFSVLGSAQKVSQINFTAKEMTLAEAIANAGGAIDATGDVGGFYLFRLEPKHLVERYINPADPRRTLIAGGADGAYFPVAYRVNLREARAYFFARATQMRDKDLILVTNAETTQLNKLITTIRGFSGIYYDVKPTGVQTTPSPTTP